MSNYDQNNLFNSLHRYALLVGTVSCAQHLILDGIMSIPMITGVFYLICTQYWYLSRNPYSGAHIKKLWHISKVKTFVRIFSLTILSLLRIVLLSLHESEVDGTIAVFLAYVQLLIAFTDNLSFCCEMQESRPSFPRRNLRRRNGRFLAAAAA
uniref:DUF1211 domain-containing protein n=1 Tax=Haemonchus contortus TaxID=6289 RepID=A0A7I5E7I6_HAECO|nr:unnamed protein product [Haemonchus contortus]